MSFDVIIPTYKPGEKFSRLLQMMRKQTVKLNRLIIMNTEEKFWKKEFEDIYPLEVHHIKRADFDHGGTRRAAAGLSDAEFFVCMTEDAIPADDRLFEMLLAPFNDPKVGASYARQIVDAAAGEIERYTRLFNYPAKSSVKSRADIEKLGIKAYFLSDVCAMYRKSAYTEAGGFVKQAVFAEDMLMASALMDKGYCVAYAADARVIHYHEYTAAEQFHRNFDMGAGQADFDEVFGKVKSESEGVKYVKKTVAHLNKCGKPGEAVKFIWQSGAKYMGYRLGKKYKSLPKSMVLKMCSNRGYFEKVLK